MTKCMTACACAVIARRLPLPENRAMVWPVKIGSNGQNPTPVPKGLAPSDPRCEDPRHGSAESSVTLTHSRKPGWSDSAAASAESAESSRQVVRLTPPTKHWAEREARSNVRKCIARSQVADRGSDVKHAVKHSTFEGCSDVCGIGGARTPQRSPRK